MLTRQLAADDLFNRLFVAEQVLGSANRRSVASAM
jgi:hypothetical protein